MEDVADTDPDEELRESHMGTSDGLLEAATGSVSVANGDNLTAAKSDVGCPESSFYSFLCDIPSGERNRARQVRTESLSRSCHRHAPRSICHVGLYVLISRL